MEIDLHSMEPPDQVLFIKVITSKDAELSKHKLVCLTLLPSCLNGILLLMQSRHGKVFPQTQRGILHNSDQHDASIVLHPTILLHPHADITLQY